MRIATIQRVDITNLLMIVLAALLAWTLPIQLFVLSYVVLGPLHYLTEIGWLHGKNYFGNVRKPNYLPYTLILPVLVLSAIMVRSLMPPMLSDWLTMLMPYQAGIIIGTLLWSISFVVKLTDTQRLFFLVALLIAGYLLTKWYWPSVYIGLLIPTLVHVFLFTGLFMVLGALQYGTWYTYLSLGVFLVAGASFFILPMAPHNLLTTGSAYWQEAWQFSGLNRVLALLTGQPTLDTLSLGDIALRWQGFIAWAYTYHYLNWFTKVEVIKWHKVPRAALTIAGLCWVAAIALYIYDLRLGLQVLYSLSMLHVVLEFPLNMRSLTGISSKIWARRLT